MSGLAASFRVVDSVDSDWATDSKFTTKSGDVNKRVSVCHEKDEKGEGEDHCRRGRLQATE